MRSGRTRIVTHTFCGELTPVTDPRKAVEGAKNITVLARPQSPTKMPSNTKMPDIKEGPSALTVIDADAEPAPVKQPKKVLEADVADTEAFPTLAGPSKQVPESSTTTLRILGVSVHPRVAALKKRHR